MPRQAATTRPKRKRQTKTPSVVTSSRVSDPGSDEGDSTLHNKKPRKDNIPELSKISGDSVETELPSDEVEENDGHACLSATCHGGKFAAAFYNPAERIMYLVEDTTESTHFDLARMCFEQAKPTLIIVPSRADEEFITMCRDYMEESGGIFQVRPHREFVPDKGRNKMLSLSIFSGSSVDDTASIHSESATEYNSTSRNAYDFMRNRRQKGQDPGAQNRHSAIRMANYWSDSAPMCASSIGALLGHLSRSKAATDLEHEGVHSLDIQAIEILALDEVMQINTDALFSLQIFEDEGHASVHSDKSKEGLSLFGILNFTKTSLGKALLRQWCLRPSISIPTINARHDAVACFLRGENLILAETMHSQLKGLKNVPRAMNLLKNGRATTKEWQDMVKCAYHVSLLLEEIGDLSHARGVEIIEKMIENIDVSKFKEMGTAINETIDWETSENERRTCVRQHIDEQLDEYKRIYHGLDSLLTKVALQVKRTVPSDWATSLNVLYFPQLGYLICVPLRKEWTDPSYFNVIEGWTYQFSSEDSVYFKSQEMLDLDEHIGDLHTSINDLEIEIVHQLQEATVVYEKDVSSACEICAELDCLLSFATASRVFDYCRPVMVEDNVIEIIKGRHPLVEQWADLFVPNDAYVAGGEGIRARNHILTESASLEDSNSSTSGTRSASVVICTGANACGKSVYLKQNALIPFMAQIGCFVPAESATLGVVDKIFTRLQTKESVSKIQSAFMIDLNQVSLALRNATARSLILLDEFGKGTISSDGAGLFCGVLEYLLRATDVDGNSVTPKVLVATHFHEVFTNGLLDASLPISYVHMEAVLSTDNGELLDMDSAVTMSRDRGRDGHHGHEFVGAESEGSGKVEIHYMYRVAEGLSLNSHATKCALLYGIPRSIVDRAEHVSDLVSRHELAKLLDEDMSERERGELEEAEAVCRAFVAWDLSTERDEVEHGVRDRLGEALGLVGLNSSSGS